MAQKPHYDVFLSHNSADKPAVEELARRLVKQGLQPWLDKWNLIPGEPWQEAIEEALGCCATCAVFIGPSGTGPWQNEEMRTAIDRRVSESGGRFRVIPVLLPGAERGERSRLPTFLVATTWVEFRRTLDDEDAFHRLICGIRGVEPGPGPGQAIYEGKCPYRGLRVFDVQHAPFFFGREALTEWLLDALRSSTEQGSTNRFLAIIGPSGSGKSSLARAGLVAALQRGEIEGSVKWPVVICRPGADPLESLAVALSDLPSADRGLSRLLVKLKSLAVALGDLPLVTQSPSAVLDLMQDLRDDERILHLTARLALRNGPPEQRLVLLVDQFEELFTLCRDEGLRQAFWNNLLYAASVTDGRTVTLLTLRADFYGRCAAYPTLAAALSDHQILVGPMTTDEQRHAIERPAQLAGCEFETGLVELLLQDVQNQPGSLPLLQHALLELWERRQGQRLTHTAYQAIGHIEGALEQRAEAVYNRFTAAKQQICRKIFLRLTQPGEGTKDTRRRATLAELPPAESEAANVESVVRDLADARLLTTGQDEHRAETVDVAHEALILGWTRLRRWIDEDRAGLLILRRLTEAASEWKIKDRDRSYLYLGSRLVEAEEWADEHANEMNVLEHDFLQASVAEREREEWEREEQREKEQRLADLSLHLSISQAVSSSLDPHQVIAIILEAALQATEAHYARLILLDNRGDPQEVMTQGESGGYRITSLDRVMVHLGREDRPIAVENIAQARGIIEPGLVNPDTQALIAVPMRSKDHHIGVVWLGYSETHQFSTTEIDFLSTLASQAAVAVENSQLFQVTEGGRRRLAAILESTSDVVIVTDHADRVLLLNPAAAETFKVDSQAVSGLPITEVIQEEKVIRLLTEPMRDSMPLTDEIPLPDDRTLYASASLIASSDGQIGRVAVLRDITHLKELDQMKSDFVTTVSHDLRAPLTFMRGYATMIPMVDKVSSKQQMYVEKIMTGIEQITELVDDLLDLGRIEAGVGLMHEPCRLDEIIVTLANSMRPQATANGLTITPNPTEEVTIVVGDAALLRQAISNLVENAIKYTPQDGTVAIGWETRGDRVLISVADNGIGIAKADQVRLFEKFYRIKRRDTIKIKGSGLGLAIVKSIAEQHNGRVWVESELDQGSTFYIELPIGEFPKA